MRSELSVVSDLRMGWMSSAGLAGQWRHHRGFPHVVAKVNMAIKVIMVTKVTVATKVACGFLN
jgi:hypothetical protein